MIQLPAAAVRNEWWKQKVYNHRPLKRLISHSVISANVTAGLMFASPKCPNPSTKTRTPKPMASDARSALAPSGNCTTSEVMARFRKNVVSSSAKISLYKVGPFKSFMIFFKPFTSPNLLRKLLDFSGLLAIMGCCCCCWSLAWRCLNEPSSGGYEA